MKILKIITALLYTSLALQCQTKNEAKKMDTDFKIDTQKVSYKNTTLPFGKSLNEWIKILGHYDRVLPSLEEKYIIERTYTWDKLGIAIVEFGRDNEVKIIPEMYIFFSNLDSDIGQKGKLEFALGRESLRAIIKRNTEKGYSLNPVTIKELKEDQSNGNSAPYNYIYPFMAYKKSLNIEGVEIKQGMTVSQINELRKNANLPLIKYWDTDMNPKEEEGSTVTKSNGYFTYLYPHKYIFDEEKKIHKYNILYRYTEQELEYIKVVHDTGQEYN